LNHHEALKTYLGASAIMLAGIFPTSINAKVLGEEFCGNDLSAGIGTIYHALVMAISRNPSLRNNLLRAAVFGHASVIAGNDVTKIKDLYDAILVDALK
jgi:F0F1-type ATP synthase membrane subunit c/vacuolar-type H+-ATPase subunit K